MDTLLTLNAGSSTIKFALYPKGGEGAALLSGKVAKIGRSPVLEIGEESWPLQGGPDAPYAQFFGSIFAAIAARRPDAEMGTIAHRIVHGGEVFDGPVVIDRRSRAMIAELAPLAPLHQKPAIEGLDEAVRAFPAALQTASFDTSFHARKAEWASVYALPPEWRALGLERYGFHGLSYDYLSAEIRRRFGPEARRVVAAHLGSGASLCAMVEGKSVASTMGFSALGGVPMATRPGDLDPGAILHLMGKGLSFKEIEEGLYRRSGLLGLSGLSGDMSVLLASEAPEAKLAVEHFTRQVAGAAASMAVAAGGLDLLVFSGGIGENAAPVREAICQALAFFGIVFDRAANAAGEACIGRRDGRPAAVIVKTNEEAILRRDAENLAG